MLQSGALIKHNRNIIKTGLFVALSAKCRAWVFIFGWVSRSMLGVFR
jgi:hypothetical protein